MSNSLQDVLNRLKGMPATLGWGAVLAVSRARMNRMLEQQFTAAFNSARFLAPCSGNVGDGALDTVMFGPPVLSFEVAEQDKSSARVTIPILAGSYVAAERTRAGAPARMTRTELRQSTGATLVMDIDLEQVLSDSDHTGRVSLNIAHARNPVCNLSSDSAVQKQIGEFLLAHIQSHPSHRTTYVLGLIDAGHYSALNPVKFAMRTVAAPGSRDPGARNAGDGAVLIFMKLQGYNEDEVTLPGPEYPHLIPDDEAGGEPIYSATLLINKDLAHFITDANLDVLNSSVLPKGYAFGEADNGRYTPYDTAIFGNLVETRDHVTVVPAIIEMESTQSHGFKALRGDGTEMTGVTWSSGCINSPLMKGEMSADGTFSATGYPFAGLPVMMTAVTARYSGSSGEETATALAMVHYVPITLQPFVAPVSPGDGPVDVVAGGDARDEPKEWTLLEPGIGELHGTNGMKDAAYSPPPTGGVPILFQRLQADTSDERTRQSVIALHTGVEVMLLSPEYVKSNTGGGEYTFEVLGDSIDAAVKNSGLSEDDDLFFRWSLVGEGTIVGAGRTAQYTPPATRAGASLAVIVCEILGPGVELYAYGIAELMRRSNRDTPPWEIINKFEITAPDGDSCTANGMQQIRLRVLIETAPVKVEGIEYLIPISVTELASLHLVHGNSIVPAIHEHQEGMLHDDDRQWASSKARNRFRLSPRGGKGGAETPLPTPLAENQTYADIYLHMKGSQSEDFHAQFRADDGRMFSSRDHGAENDFVKLRTTPVPTMGKEDYVFERERVWDGEGKYDGEDEFSYMLQSICFWNLSFREANFETIGFSTLHIEGNSSSLQYESELLDETFASFTGYAFNGKDLLVPPSPPPTKLSFDPYLVTMMDELNFKAPDASFHNHGPPQPGTLLISVHRESELPFWYDGMDEANRAKWFRKALDPVMIYTLRDEDGNRHRMRIGFLEPSIENSRNHLRLILQN